MSIPFDDIDISTETIIGKTNCKININELFAILPVVPYRVIPKKRGRRPKNEKREEPQKLNNGDIITIKMGDNIRGVELKTKKKTSNNNYFRNSLTIVMSCDDKFINFKITKNGKFQFTGCKNDRHSHECLSYVIAHINACKRETTKKILSLPLNTSFEVIYLTVMANINFSLGFCVNKENLDNYINKETDYYSLLETTFGYTGVNIKIPLPNLNKVPVTKMVLTNEQTNEWAKHHLTYENYTALLDEKEKQKEVEKNHYNTFLIFQSGNVILSSPHKECMRETYFEFLKIIEGCRDVIEEKIG
jgi:TATA-box binding protein (TBP) (component of TFIID and TFIIIB)